MFNDTRFGENALRSGIVSISLLNRFNVERLGNDAAGSSLIPADVAENEVILSGG
jgi:hypothetical protein